MRLKFKLVSIVAFMLSAVVFAQESYTVNGTVTSAVDNLPIPGVNIVIVNTTTGTSTDFDGNYQLEVTSGDVLQFSYVGFVTQTVTVEAQQTIDVALVEDASALDEVVVIGYGTRKKSSLTGAVSQVKGEDVAAIQATRVDDALAGKLADVLIQNQSVFGEIVCRRIAPINASKRPPS